MQTLKQLQAGELLGTTRVKLVENLTDFPDELFTLADSLEILDLSGNQLRALPDDFARLQNLKILFLSENQFDHFPMVLGQCQNLEMIGFKANQIKTVPEDSLPPQTRWLILTDNQINALPESIGKLTRLQKLMLAGNQLNALPNSMANCKNLQLIRLSANQLPSLPDWLLTLPNLAWLAFAGNPLCKTEQPSQSAETDLLNNRLPTVTLDDLEINTLLGEGASGLIYQANWRLHAHLQTPPKHALAVKLFKGAVTSDGYPEDELNACVMAGQHANLVNILAEVCAPPESDELDKTQTAKQAGLVMERIPETYANLGLPPCFKSCTRDHFADGFSLTPEQVEKILLQVTDVLTHLHTQQLCHGDLYAHNILLDEQANILLTDFGAASPFCNLPEHQQSFIKTIEQRALRHLKDDLLTLQKTSSVKKFIST